MTREEMKELLPIIQEWVEGKTLEYYNTCTGELEVVTRTIFVNPNKYRIKPEAKYRPFKTQEECWQEMHKHSDFGWLKGKIDGRYRFISEMFTFPDSYTASKLGTVPFYSYAFEGYTFADGTPFGIKEE